MADPKDHPELRSDPSWQVQTQVLRAEPGLGQQGAGSDCLVVIYTREGRGPLGKRIPLDGPMSEVTIGREVSNSLVLEFEGVSRRHARLQRRDGVWWVQDQNSTNGTYVNDVATKETPLRNGDRVKVGDVILKYLSAGDLEAEFIETISQMMVTDGLTQAANKRHFVEKVTDEVNRSLRHERPCCLVMFDVDHFKKVNDTYGHVAGDVVLKEIASLVRTRIRRNEVFGRYGGEEFAVLLPETTLQGAVTLAQELCTLVASQPFVFDTTRIPVTISLGVAAWNPAIRTCDDFVRAADQKLYEAKRQGRNRVVS